MNRTMTLAAALALLGATATAVHAGTVNLSSWAVTAGSWDRVVTMKNEAPGSPTFGRDVYAGGFAGVTSGFTGDDEWVNSSTLLAYCVEFTESFSLASGAMSDYNVVAGASYAHWGLASGAAADADRMAISGRLGQLMTYVGGLTIDTREESAAVQLAIWEIIYETPVGFNLSLTEGNLIESRSTAANTAVRTLANGLLANSASTQSQYEVFVLTRDGKQDFIALREGGSFQQQFVPEPGAMGLSLAALVALGFAARRRRRG